jgi:hypothetical protein
MARPIGIVGNAFSLVWSDRDRLLLVQRMRDAFAQGGFDAEVVCTGTAEMLSGQATLHIKATCPSRTLEAVARQLGGVLGCRTLSEGQQRITYDPHVTGGRQLLARLKEAVGPEAEVEWTSASNSDEQHQSHVRHIRDLQRDLCRAAPPAAVISPRHHASQLG